MKDNARERGTEILESMDKGSVDRIINNVKEIAPEMSDYIIEFAFGNIYDRGILSLSECEMITLSSILTLGGCEKQLEAHINYALGSGLSKEKIIEVFIHCLPYAGFPKVLNAIDVAKKVFKNYDKQ